MEGSVRIIMQYMDFNLLQVLCAMPEKRIPSPGLEWILWQVMYDSTLQQSSIFCSFSTSAQIPHLDALRPVLNRGGAYAQGYTCMRWDPWCGGLPLSDVRDVSETSASSTKRWMPW